MFVLFLLATLSCLMEPVTSFIINILIRRCCKKTDKDQEIRKQLISLKKDMNNISMVDEFALYAKMQRRYNKLEDETREKLNERLLSRTKLKMSMTVGMRIINGIFTITLTYLYRSEPVIIFPNGYLWPIGSLLSWPTGIDSCISLPVWIILMRLSISSLSKTNI